MHAKIDKSWIRAVRRNVQAALVSRYGEQWRNCFSKDVQKALIEAEVLHLVMAQVMEKYTPAQELARAVLTTPDKLWPSLIEEG